MLSLGVRGRLLKAERTPGNSQGLGGRPGDDLRAKKLKALASRSVDFEATFESYHRSAMARKPGLSHRITLWRKAGGDDWDARRGLFGWLHLHPTDGDDHATLSNQGEWGPGPISAIEAPLSPRPTLSAI